MSYTDYWKREYRVHETNKTVKLYLPIKLLELKGWHRGDYFQITIEKDTISFKKVRDYNDIIIRTNQVERAYENYLNKLSEKDSKINIKEEVI